MINDCDNMNDRCTDNDCELLVDLIIDTCCFNLFSNTKSPQWPIGKAFPSRCSVISHLNNTVPQCHLTPVQH